MKKMLLPAALLSALAMSVPASAQNIGGCALDGLAKLSPGLGANTPAPGGSGTIPVAWGAAFTYSFSGTLSNCVNVDDVPPDTATSGGNIAAGESFTYKGIAYEHLGKATGSGGCTGSHTEGSAVVTWSDGTISVIDYDTDGVTAAIGLTGEFRDGSVTLTRVQRGPNGELVKDTYPLALGGNYTGGPLVFHPEDPTQCMGGSLTEAPITGFIAQGNYQ